VTCYFILGLNFAFSLVLGALATATAPASTIMTIRQTGAKGDFVETLLQVVALDDVVGLILYSMAISLATAVFSSTGFHISHVLIPIGKNLLLVGLGCLFGLLMKLIIGRRSTDNRLIVAVALLFSYCGICAVLDISPLLGCMAMGMVYINTTEDERLFRQLNYFSPPILLLFFFRSGLSFDLGSLVGNSDAIGAVPLLVIGVIYFFVRIVGKYLGAYSGCKLAGKSQKVSRYLGLALIPQAGVAIGLAALGARELGGEMGRALETIILSSSVLYELIGPGAAKLSLYLSGSYSNELEDIAPVQETSEDGRKKSEVELLIERIQKIQSELPAHTENENERAFTEAAEEYYHGQNVPAPPRAPRRRII
jgi:Kef-type K+ transport system membrane component KefB